MTTLINARSRFGLEGDRLFCYVTSRYYDITPGAMLEADEGVWPLEKVAELIRGGATIERALLTRNNLDLQYQLDSYATENEQLKTEIRRLNDLHKDPAVTSDTPQPDKVEQAVADFNAATPPPAEGDKVEQAKQDFLNEPSETQVIGEADVGDAASVVADVEGAEAQQQEAPPKGE